MREGVRKCVTGAATNRHRAGIHLAIGYVRKLAKVAGGYLLELRHGNRHGYANRHADGTAHERVGECGSYWGQDPGSNCVRKTAPEAATGVATGRATNRAWRAR